MFNRPRSFNTAIPYNDKGTILLYTGRSALVVTKNFFASGTQAKVNQQQSKFNSGFYTGFRQGFN